MVSEVLNEVLLVLEGVREVAKLSVEHLRVVHQSVVLQLVVTQVALHFEIWSIVLYFLIR